MLKGYLISLCSLMLFATNTTFANAIDLRSSPNNKFFIGVGSNFNSANLQNQTLYGKGINQAYTGPFLTSSGSADGYSHPFYQNKNIFSPQVQIGCLKHINNDPNFLGMKLAYNYLDVNFSNNDMTISQAGSNYNYLTQQTTYFTGNYAVESVQTTLKHEFLLLGFIGQALAHGDIYVGAGPALFQMKSNIDHLIGYADYKGTPGTNISGAPVNFSNSIWKWGAAAQIGMTYELGSCWFLDFNYTYAKMFNNVIQYAAPFTNQIFPENLIGTSYIKSSQQAVVHSFGISINKSF